MSSDTVPFLLLLTIMAGVFHFIPTLTRPDLFFAITVPAEFRRTPDARRILLRYRAVIWGVTLAAIALDLMVGNPLAALVLQGLGFPLALIDCHRAARAFAVAPASVVEVDLAAPQERLPGGPMVAALPVLSIGALALWAGLHPDRLPQNLPVHWGFHGADRWAVATPTAVFVFLGLQAFACLFMVVLAVGLLHWSRRISTTGAGAAAERHFRRRLVELLVVCEYFLACPAWFGLFLPSASIVNAWGVALAVVIVAFTVSLIRGGQGGSQVAVSGGSAPLGDRTPDDCWKWGLIYANPADPSILVEKRFGVGYTLNFGNGRTWMVLAVLLLPAAAAVIFIR